jgi:hypothetical protein
MPASSSPVAKRSIPLIVMLSAWMKSLTPPAARAIASSSGARASAMRPTPMWQ